MTYKNSDFNKLVEAYTSNINEGIFDRLGARASGALGAVKGFWGGEGQSMSGARGKDQYQMQKFTSYLNNKMGEIQKDLAAMGLDQSMIQNVSLKLNDTVAQISKDIETSGAQAQEREAGAQQAANVAGQAQQSAEQLGQATDASQQAAAAANARSTQAAGATQMASTANQRYGNASSTGATTPAQQQATQEYEQGVRYNPMTGNQQQVQQTAQKNVGQGFQQSQRPPLQPFVRR